MLFQTAKKWESNIDEYLSYIILYNYITIYPSNFFRWIAKNWEIYIKFIDIYKLEKRLLIH